MSNDADEYTHAFLAIFLDFSNNWPLALILHQRTTPIHRSITRTRPSNSLIFFHSQFPSILENSLHPCLVVPLLIHSLTHLFLPHEFVNPPSLWSEKLMSYSLLCFSTSCSFCSIVMHALLISPSSV